MRFESVLKYKIEKKKRKEKEKKERTDPAGPTSPTRPTQPAISPTSFFFLLSIFFLGLISFPGPTSLKTISPTPVVFLLCYVSEN
jgi:hypothetical protein